MDTDFVPSKKSKPRCKPMIQKLHAVATTRFYSRSFDLVRDIGTSHAGLPRLRAPQTRAVRNPLTPYRYLAVCPDSFSPGVDMGGCSKPLPCLMLRDQPPNYQSKGPPISCRLREEGNNQANLWFETADKCGASAKCDAD